MFELRETASEPEAEAMDIDFSLSLELALLTYCPINC